MNLLIGNTQEFNSRIGGVEKVSDSLARMFSEMGLQVFFFACLKSQYSETYESAVEQIILPDEKYLSRMNKETLYSHCVDKRIDIILNQAGNVQEFTKLCAYVSDELRIPLISVIHTNPMARISSIMDYKNSAMMRFNYLKVFRRMLLMPIRYKRIYREDQKVYREVCSASDKVVLLSDGYKKDFKRLTGVDYSKKVIAIPNPINTQKTNPYQRKEKFVLFVGRLDFVDKRPDRLIHIWENLYKDYPDWKLKFAGDGSFKNHLMNYVIKRKICNVEFLGFCDSNAQYAQAAILCLTSTFEGLPMVLIEGISYGCIPISFDSFKSVYDIIEDSKNGYIIRSFKLKDYKEKLRSLMENDDLREKMSKDALESSRKFELNVIALQWISLFNELIGKKNNG